MVLDRIRKFSFRFQVGRIDPFELELATALHRSVLESLDDGHVRVLKGGVLANEHDLNRVEKAFGAAPTNGIC